MGFGTLLIAHICFNIPYVILSVGPKLRQMDRNLVDAAQDLGCTWMQAFWKVVLPEIKPGIVSGALTAFTMSVDDFIISYFTAGTCLLHPGHDHLRHDEKAGEPRDQRHLHPAVRDGACCCWLIVNIRESRGQQKPAAVQAARRGEVSRPPGGNDMPALPSRRVGDGCSGRVPLCAALVVTGAVQRRV